MSPRFSRKFSFIKSVVSPYKAYLIGAVILVLTIYSINSWTAWLESKNLTPNAVRAIMVKDYGQNLESYQNRTNLLLMGIAGGEHTGSDLTDTLIFISIDLTTNDAFVISLPRDIWSPTLQDKINSAYHYGQEKKVGGGYTLAKSIVEEVLGQPIHYAFIIDFAGFEKAIDVVGGIEVDVPTGFTDKRFPIPGKENDNCEGDLEYDCRYKSVSFTKSLQQMNGEAALTYVRSRNAQGLEGSDYARSQRQQIILQSFRAKLSNVSILINPFKTKELYKQLRATFRSDADLAETLTLLRLAAELDLDNARKIELNQGSEKQTGWLYNPPTSRYDRWVLSPINDSFEIIHKLIDCHLSDYNCNLKPEDYK